MQKLSCTFDIFQLAVREANLDDVVAMFSGGFCEMFVAQCGNSFEM